MCQTSSIDFLVGQNFDFNKVFRDGISYLRPCDVAKLRQNILEKQQIRKAFTPKATESNGSNFIVPDEQKAFVQETLAKVEAWLNDSANASSLILDNCNAFQRRILYNTVKPKFSGDFNFLMESVPGKTDKDRFIKLTKVDADEQKQLEEDRDSQELEELEQAAGFAKVIQKISESKKMIVGHNMFLDLLYTIQQFVAPLPEDYEEFKQMIHSVWPKVI